MTRTFFFVSIFLLCSCATGTKINPITLEVPNIGVTDFAFLDGRLGGIETTKFRDENRTVTVVGDEVFKPPVPDVFKFRLQSKYGSKLNKNRVLLSHLRIEIHERDPELNESAYNASTPGVDPVSGLIARWIIKGIESRKINKIVLVELKGALNDQPFSIVENGYFKGNGEEEIRRVVLLAVDNAVDSVEPFLK